MRRRCRTNSPKAESQQSRAPSFSDAAFFVFQYRHSRTYPRLARSLRFQRVLRLELSRPTSASLRRVRSSVMHQQTPDEAFLPVYALWYLDLLSAIEECKAESGLLPQ